MKRASVIPLPKEAERDLAWTGSCAFLFTDLRAGCTRGTGSAFAAWVMGAWVSILVPTLVLRGPITALRAGLFMAHLLVLLAVGAVGGGA